MTQDVNRISKDKRYGRGALNVGKVTLKCVINGYCPLQKGRYNDIAMPFNYETAKTFPSSFRKHCQVLESAQGIFLRPYHSYLSTFIDYFPPLGKETDEVKEDPDLKYIPHEIAQPVASEIANVPYRREQAFIARDGLFWVQGSYVHYPEAIKAEASSRSQDAPDDVHNRMRGRQSSPAWMYRQGKAPTEDANEATYGVLYASVMGNAEQLTEGSGGTHWSLTKRTPLFRGEDFAIEFLRTTPATADVSVSDPPPTIFHQRLACIDVNAPPNAADGKPPQNAGVVDYEIEHDTSTGKATSYKKVEGSGKPHELCSQSYYVIELGPHQAFWNFVIILTQRGKPICVKIMDGISHKLSVYEHAEGKDLFDKDVLRVTVRNHLGKLAITFNDYEDRPWIIENMQIQENVNDDKYAMVSADTIKIWGGNISAAINFSPLRYIPSYTLELPPQSRYTGGQDLGVNSTRQPMDMPSLGISLCAATVSANDQGLHGFSGGLNNGNYFGSRTPFFTSDASYIVDGGWHGTQSVVAEPTFMDIGTTLREESQKSKKSSIELKIIDDKKHSDDFTASFWLNVGLKAGSYIIPTKTSEGKDYEWEIENCITPILSQLRLVSIPNGRDKWNASGVDVSDHVLSFQDSWNAPDFYSIEHTGSIRFLINKGMSFRDNKTDYLYNLRNKGFYIEVWAGYSDKEEATETRGSTKTYTKLPNLFKLFTGFCQGGTIIEEAGQRFMECKIEDYSRILQDTIFLNSPFFDGMKDTNAVFEILQMADFKYDSSRDPAFLLSAASRNDDDVTMTSLDGRPSRMNLYALPSSYDRLQNPFFKFKDGEYYWEALKKMAQRAGKVLFFDAHGVLHYENLPFESALYGDASSSIRPLWWFTSNPKGYGQLILESVTKDASVSDVYNDLHLISTTPDFELIIAHDSNYSSWFNPNSVGFLGYKKMFLQMDGIFGSEATLLSMLRHYAKFYKPPVVVKFSTYGQPVRGLDVVAISTDGSNNYQPLIVVNVSNDINAENNKWSQTVEGEWYGGETTVRS